MSYKFLNDELLNDELLNDELANELNNGICIVT